jgi:hypothetical protein
MANNPNLGCIPIAGMPREEPESRKQLILSQAFAPRFRAPQFSAGIINHFYAGRNQVSRVIGTGTCGKTIPAEQSRKDTFFGVHLFKPPPH